MEEQVEIDLSNTKLGDHQGDELQTLFNSLRGLFSDKPGLTYVLYHEIDTGDKPSVVSRPYRYDRVKQKIVDYHVNKMPEEGTITVVAKRGDQDDQEKTSLREDRLLHRISLSNRKLNSLQILKQWTLTSNVSVCPRTVRGRLLEIGLRGCKACPKPLLTEFQRKR
ncbi:hypothetical protein TNCV_2595521 [Trichonephila clavipes]|nr:hypothetical protein TNCV_2595521 [Trichonephila clavipes]